MTVIYTNSIYHCHILVVYTNSIILPTHNQFILQSKTPCPIHEQAMSNILTYPFALLFFDVYIPN